MKLFIYYLLKCIYGTLQAFTVIKQSLVYKNFKIYLHGQGIAGWIAVLTCEPKYIKTERNSHTKGGTGIGC